MSCDTFAMPPPRCSLVFPWFVFLGSGPINSIVYDKVTEPFNPPIFDQFHSKANYIQMYHLIAAGHHDIPVLRRTRHLDQSDDDRAEVAINRCSHHTELRELFVVSGEVVQALIQISMTITRIFPVNSRS